MMQKAMNKVEDGILYSQNTKKSCQLKRKLPFRLVMVKLYVPRSMQDQRN